MLFNSLVFILFFLPVMLTGFYLLGRVDSPVARRAAAWWLALGSLFFYGWWDERYVLLLCASVGVNFLAGAAIARRVQAGEAQAAKQVLAGVVVANLALLGYYKYALFLVENLSRLSGVPFTMQAIVLPLGISFFTFTQIAFLVDCYKGKVREYRFGHYLLFVTYFPHLIAGPVLHHADMMPQFADPRTYRPQAATIAAGVMLFSLGLFKKVIAADGIVQYATPVFSAAASGYQPGFWESNSAAFSYAMQLYFDFSGYSDMAVGLSWLFGITLPVNFNSPYRSASLIEFWRRWHISLSTFLRDYLYVPLGGNRLGALRRYLNLGLTMLLGGLWHGAAWTFVLWGALHGIGLMLNHAWQNLRQRHALPELPRWLGVVLTFYCVMVLWVIFRAADLPTAWRMISGMWAFGSLDTAHNIHPLVHLNWILWPSLVVFFAPNSQQWVVRASGWLRGEGRYPCMAPWVLGGVFAWCFWWALTRINRVSEFLYFQF